jgi:hypothetical protein
MVDRQDAWFSEREASFVHHFFELRGECVICFPVFPNAHREESVSLSNPRVKKRTGGKGTGDLSSPFQLALYCSAVIAGGL